MLEIYEVKCCGLAGPLGLGEGALRFSWKLRSDVNGTVQRSCRVTVLDADTGSPVWDSGGRGTAEQSLTACNSEGLRSNRPCRCVMEAVDNHGCRAEGALAVFTLGLQAEELGWRAVKASQVPPGQGIPFAGHLEGSGGQRKRQLGAGFWPNAWESA